MPLYFSVPCGHCEECRKARRTEWFVRAFYQWQQCKKNGGMCYFETLTFSEEHCPTFNGVRCFDRDLIQRFAKRFKMRLLRKFGVKMTYIITSEFGTMFQRPHHHALFYLDKPLNCVLFQHELDAAWSYGFTKPGQGFGIVQSSNALLYVTKYITKDEAFQNCEQLLYDTMRADWSSRYNEWRKTASHTYPVTFSSLLSHRSDWCGNPEVAEWYRSFYREYHRRSPFNAHSIGFGACLALPEYKNDTHYINLDKDIVRIPHGNSYQEVPLPRYLKRKFYYDTVLDENGKPTRFVLNEYGKQHLLDTLEDKIQQRAQKIAEVFSVNLTDYQLHELLKKTLMTFETRQDYDYFRQTMVTDLDYRRLAIYSVVYRNRFRPEDKEYDVWHEYKRYLQDVFAEVEDLTQPSLRQHSKRIFAHLHNSMWNWHEEFEPYEYLWDFYSNCKNLLDAERAQLVKEKDSRKRALREILYKINK